ncbi:efflux RND transporter periplasmic adaptor subunit [Sediminitomix flava]|uniref:RND family efflux transporter MFP subunit n=1 Tax=Sediminitomix flava TaxID=379075 RepID=A0A315YWR8_SEDFL|nr:efflux RND transporter periplasmic adaptor subunit [Sediminitomix flava]PWJ34214.1 RND family efflux transporter MFP subunit [Sediminitomix flava]
MASYREKIAVAAMAFLLAACADDSKSLEEKQALLEQYKSEHAVLSSKIELLEKEIAAGGNIVTVSNLKRVTGFQTELSQFEHFVEVPANITSDKNVTVSPEMNGRLTRILVKEGQYVKRGQRLGQLDTEVLNKQIEEIKTNLDLATTLYEKQDRLWKQGVGSEVQYLQVKNQKETLEAGLASLEEQKGKGYVLAPISGTVDDIFANEGELAAPGQPFARIVNLNKVEVVAEVSEVYSKQVKKGDEVTVRIPLMNDEYKRPILSVGKFINPQNRTFRIQVELDNREAELKPNTMAVVRIRDYQKEDVVVLPSYLVQHSADGTEFVYVLENKGGESFVKKVVVTTGKSYAGKTMIEEGLAAGMTIVDKGYSDVTNGEKVVLVK